MAKNCDMCVACEYQYAIYFELKNGMKFKVLISEDAYLKLFEYSINFNSMHDGLVSMLKNVELDPDGKRVQRLE